MLNIDVTEMTVPQMQSIVRENGLEVQGDKRRRVNLEPVVSKWQDLQKEAIALAVDAKLALEESAVESVAAADATETVAVLAVDKAVEILTAPETVNTLKLVLRVVAVAIAFTFFTAYKVGVWCWERRENTAVYHWVTGATAFVVARLHVPIVEIR